MLSKILEENSKKVLNGEELVILRLGRRQGKTTFIKKHNNIFLEQKKKLWCYREIFRLVTKTVFIQEH